MQSLIIFEDVAALFCSLSFFLLNSKNSRNIVYVPLTKLMIMSLNRCTDQITIQIIFINCYYIYNYTLFSSGLLLDFSLLCVTSQLESCGLYYTAGVTENLSRASKHFFIGFRCSCTRVSLRDKEAKIKIYTIT